MEEQKDLMRDPSVYQIVQSPSNTYSERHDTEEVCYRGDNTIHEPTYERRMNRGMMSMPKLTLGPKMFSVKTMTIRSLGSKR